jgi:hypothetical protein
MVFSKSDGMASLLPHRDRLRRAVHAAWGRWLTDIRPRYVSSGPRSGRNVVHDLLVEELGREFSGVPGCGIVQRAHRNLLIIDDRLILTIKHLNDRRRPVNYPTETARAFNEQAPLPGFPEGVRLVLGYVLDELELRIVDTCVILPNGEENVWCVSLESDRSSEIHELLPRIEVGTRRPRVRLKESVRKRKDRDASGE